MAFRMNKLANIPTANIATLLGAGGVLLGGGYLALNSFYTVEAGHQAIVFSRWSGVKNVVYGEGLHFKVPWLEREIIYPTRAVATKIQASTGSKDLQIVQVTLRLLYKPNAQKLPVIYRNLGMDYANRVIPSLGAEVLKSVVAKYTAAELITNRPHVSNAIRSRIVKRCGDFGIELDDVAITDLAFGREYTQAIEAKQVAQQEAERAKFIVERARETKKEIVAKAEGEKRAAQKFNETLQRDPSGNFLSLRRIDAAKEIATYIAAGNNRVYLNADILLLNQTVLPNLKVAPVVVKR